MEKKLDWKLEINYNLRKVESISGFGDRNQNMESCGLERIKNYKIKVSVNFKISP